jgi:hypothetical protein
VTVTIGVVTVAVVLVGRVTVTAVTGVLTVTLVATVGIGSAGRETVGTRSVEGNVEAVASALDEAAEAEVVSPPEACVDAPTALTVAPPAFLP